MVCCSPMTGRGRGNQSGRPALEVLERRVLLAGDIAAAVLDGELAILGDDQSNRIIIERSPTGTDSNTFQLTPVDGTTINGSAEPLTISGVQSIRLEMGGGDDSVLLRDARLYGAFSFGGGEGRDVLTMLRVTVHGAVLLDAGAGRDTIHLANVRARDSVTIDDRLGPSSLHLNRLWVDGVAAVRTGNSIDQLDITDSTFRHVSGFRTRGGDDTIRIRGTTIRTNSAVDAGAGDNVVDRQIILHWDFRNGEQGWRAGFADISVADEDLEHPELSPTAEVRQFYRLRSGLEALPAELNIDGTGLVLAGYNRSDDMFMYLSRALTGEHGVVAGQQYLATFSVRFASNSPAALGGIGGSPAGSVYLKVGAVPRRPRIELMHESMGNFVTLNVDKGNQSQSGTEMSVAGDAANGDQGDAQRYRIVTREHSHPESVVSAGSRLWLVVGTDSGFEGITTLYYAAITAILTPVESPGADAK
jgi:hypothetical protein